MAIDSACVTSVPWLPAEYRSVRQSAVPPRYASAVVAFGTEASILPFRVLNSASVMSEVQHVACALLVPSEGTNGWVHLALREVVTMLVVVCRSHWAWRQTRWPSLVTATSHSMMPAPMRAAAV
eukprot:1189011-Prorocentrum_minimum.AAC.1